LEKRLGREKEGKARLGVKGPLESGKFSDGSDTIPGNVPVQGTQLRK